MDPTASEIQILVLLILVKSRMAVSTTWGLSVVVLGIGLLVVSSVESTTWETTTTRPTMAPSTLLYMHMSPTHSMDSTMRGMVMLHTTTHTSIRSGVLLS